MYLDPRQAIGVFDSGVGGLTVAHAIAQILPDERLIYFGDTAHLPYGDKSKDSIIRYSKEIGRFFIEKKCKIILIACNSASAVAYEEMSQEFEGQAMVLNVIDPVVSYLKDNYEKGKVGIIGTKATINSKTYETRIQKECTGLVPVSLATPLFVPMIEEGFIFDNISNAIIRAYLSNPSLTKIDALILACTHYPIIKNQISKFFSFNVEILDSAKIVAEELKIILKEKHLLNPEPKRKNEFYVSDFTDHFEKIAKMFFEEKINLKKVNLWE
ncbi:MAG: glutamate racemase [Bacteroidota bacterium]|nr:glutamate racemase [Bacteroidota bacterium]